MESRRGKAIQAGVRIGAAAAGGWLSTVLGPEAGPAVAETISEAGVAAVAFLDDRKSDRVSRTLIEISDEAATRIAAGEKVRASPGALQRRRAVYSRFSRANVGGPGAPRKA